MRDLSRNVLLAISLRETRLATVHAEDLFDVLLSFVLDDVDGPGPGFSGTGGSDDVLARSGVKVTKPSSSSLTSLQSKQECLFLDTFQA